MQQVTFTKVSIQLKDKDGNPYKDKNGKLFTRVGVQTDKTGTDWLSCLSYNADDKVRSLKEGDEETIIITQNGQYKNFKLPNQIDLVHSRIEKLESKIKEIVQEIKNMQMGNLNSDGSKIPSFDMPSNEINVDDIPFN